MATQILDDGSLIKIVMDGTVRLTIPKARAVLTVTAVGVDISHDGKYVTSITPSEVTNPVSTSPENLRANIAALLNA